jgi:hypothetical protein
VRIVAKNFVSLLTFIENVMAFILRPSLPVYCIGVKILFGPYVVNDPESYCLFWKGQWARNFVFLCILCFVFSMKDNLYPPTYRLDPPHYTSRIFKKFNVLTDNREKISGPYLLQPLYWFFVVKLLRDNVTFKNLTWPAILPCRFVGLGQKVQTVHVSQACVEYG